MSDAPLRENELPPEPPLDRTISPVAGRFGSPRTGKALAFGGLLAGCAVLALASYGADRRKPAPAPERPARQVVAFEPAKPSAAPTLAAPGPNAPRLGAADAAYVPAIAPDGDGSPTLPGPGVTPAARRSAPLMAYSRGSGLAGQGSPTLPAAKLVPDGATETELDGLRRGSRIGRMAARPVGDRNFLILAGATLPCILQTAIDTATAGYVTCLIGSDVYSDNGAVVLLDKGARVLGEYRSGMRQGQNRIFVLWTRAVTPRGIAIDLGSPASDALGRAGFGGVVDTHFWDRFGAALLLSVVDDAAYGLAGGSHDETTRLPSDAAALAVQQGADIRPTLRKPQGAEVAIQVAQDLDFSDVYGLRARR